ncbi:MAG: hypothetical protein FIA92_01705 [Chloroflexi bacterium]|nr:hypothetical protein [Chloroflexota bacterium]
MTCSNCGATGAPGQRFCGDCGSPLAAVCASCGSANPVDHRFCGACGTPISLTAGRSPAASPVATQAPGAGSRGVTPDVAGAAPPAAATADSSTGAAELPAAERRLVSVLFADLVGFTPFAEERDAEDTREMLGRYADLSRELILRYGGTVEKFIGDAVMAVWGAPVAREDDAERAVRAALELVEAVPGLGAGIQARAAVLTGEVAVNVGATNQGLVVGDIVNTAARLQSAASPGMVLVGAHTMRAASSAIAFEEAGEQVLKGKSAPVAAWRALRVVAKRGGEGRSDLPEPPFVGRHDELRELKELIATTGRDRRVRLVSITGPAGSGKSRLAWELNKYIDGISETIYWHRGRSPAYGEGITFWALGEMVRRRAGLSEHDDADTPRERVAACVAEYVESEEDRRWVEPALLTLLGVEPAPPGGRDVLFAAWRIFFEQIASRGTTVLLFEDLHWADSGLLDFIEHVVEWARNVPILVVTLARPELTDRRPDWGGTTRHLTRVALEPLPDDAMRELLAGFVPGLPEAAVETILRRADGVPLYAVETIRALVADGRLERVEDTYRPVGKLDDLEVPETLKSLIASRLDALDPVERGLVADASVLGQVFSVASLAAVSGLGEELEPRLRNLVRRELLDAELDPRSPERGQYRFVQSLIREVAYSRLAKRERRTRHLAAARYFEGAGDEELASVLATHYVAAHEASAPGPEAEAVAIQARLALSGAAERANGLGAPEQAVRYLRQAVAITTDAAERLELLLKAAEAADTAAEYQAAEELVREALAAAEDGGDRTKVGRAHSLLGQVLIDQGKIAEAAEALTAAVELLRDADAPDLLADLLANLSRAQMRLNVFDDAIRTADEALTIAERRGLNRVIAEAFNNKGASLGGVGRYREALALLQAAVEVAHDHGFVASELRATTNLGASNPSPEPALRALRASEALAGRLGHRTMSVWAAVTARELQVYMGRDWQAALEEAEAANQVGLEQGWLSDLDEARNLSVIALVQIERGETADAAIGRIREIAASISDPAVERALWTLEAERAFVAGGYGETIDAIAKVTDQSTQSQTLPLAVRAAAYLGDARRARDLLATLEALPFGDPPAMAFLAGARGTVAAREGRASDAGTGFREGMAGFTELSMDWEAARIALDVVRLMGPGDRLATEAAAKARATFEGLGAKPYLAMLEAALGPGSTAASEAASSAAFRPGSETAGA